MLLVLKCLSISCANSSRHQFWGSNQVLRSDVQLLWSSSFMFVNSNFVCIIKFQTNCWQAAMKTCFLPLLLLLGLLVAALLFRSIVNTLLLTMDLKMTVASQTRWASISLCWGGGYSLSHCPNSCLFWRLENAKVYGKGKFPYSEAAYYSSKLWHTQSEGKVVMQGSEHPSQLLRWGWSWQLWPTWKGKRTQSWILLSGGLCVLF